MATDISSAPVNGYGHGGYDQNSGYGSGNVNMQSSYNSAPTAATAGAPAANANGTTDIPKDEVGWYFVEQYYTTLSRSPEKLYVSQSNHSEDRRWVGLTPDSSFTTNDHNSSSVRRPTRSLSAWARRYVVRSQHD